MDALAHDYRDARRRTLALAEGLSAEDMGAQSMTDASPTKWHLAHTTWFFETFVLSTLPEAPVVRPEYRYLFNSYYEAVGPQFPRSQRGLLTRPSAADVLAYRQSVDASMSEAFASARLAPAAQALVRLGIEHECQHQELLLTDLLHLLAHHPLAPVYRERKASPGARALDLNYRSFSGGLVTVGADESDFHFDNEGPRHRVFLEPFSLANRKVTNGEFRAFVEDGGYRRPDLWLSAGWARRSEERWEHPLYWRRDGDAFLAFGLHGLRPLEEHAPVGHLSYFEADAYATWAGARLPTEFEWEHAMAESGRFDRALVEGSGLVPSVEVEPFSAGGTWEWTRSAYAPYPGFRPAAGAVGEYNGKFMCGQYVLRGASVATPRAHARLSYRNFFPPEARWQFTGLRLARDAT